MDNAKENPKGKFQETSTGDEPQGGTRSDPDVPHEEGGPVSNDPHLPVSTPGSGVDDAGDETE